MTQQNSNWIETKWQLPKLDFDILEAQLTQMGCLGSFENLNIDPEIEAKISTTEVIAYFPDSDLERLQSTLKPIQTETIVLTSINRIPQGNWATEWKKYFKPFAIAPGIIIRPSWEAYTPQPNEHVVVLDPGMAFGTGQHDTTRFCSELLRELKLKHPEVQSLLDIGCGSGILSIIAAKLGYKPVVGVDNDPAAVETANENLTRNPDVTQTSFHLNDGTLQHPSLKVSDVVVSNIIAETLAELAPDLIPLVKDGGYLILSGVLPNREHVVKDAFASLKLLDEKKSNDWHAYLYHK